MCCAIVIIISVLSAAGYVWLSIRMGAVEQQTETNTMKLSALSSSLATLEASVEKIRAEVTALINQTTDIDLPADAAATLERLSVLSTHIDSLIRDDIINNGTGQSQA